MADMKTEGLYQIRLVTDRSEAKAVGEALLDLGISYAYVETSRYVLLDERTSLRSMLTGRTELSEAPGSVASFLVPEDSGRACLNYLTSRLGLDAPGRGSIVAKKVSRLLAAPGLEVHRPTVGELEPKIITEDLAGICCIVVKGAGNEVATIGLTTGTAVPDLSYGIGTGLRNRLGAWRIFIPAEKEVANLVVHSDDAATVMELMVLAGKLDQAGKGFIFQYPVDMGVLETKFSLGETRQAASVEQIIYAIDEMKGSTDWRRKGLGGEAIGQGGRRYLENLVDVTFACNEGACEGLTKAAMDAGAGGATMRRLRHLALKTDNEAISPARETSVMTVGQGMVDKVVEALLSNGLVETAAAGELSISPVRRALTYLGK